MNSHHCLKRKRKYYLTKIGIEKSSDALTVSEIFNFEETSYQEDNTKKQIRFWKKLLKTTSITEYLSDSFSTKALFHILSYVYLIDQLQFVKNESR